MAARTVKGQGERREDTRPEEAAPGDVPYAIYVRQKGARGLQDVAEGRVVDEDEAERRMARWLL